MYRKPQKPFHHQYFHRVGTNPNAPLVYAPGRCGANVLDVSLQEDVGDRYVEPQLVIGDFHVALALWAELRGIASSPRSWLKRGAIEHVKVEGDRFTKLKYRGSDQGISLEQAAMKLSRRTKSVRSAQ